jgi:hypothetical protein
VLVSKALLKNVMNRYVLLANWESLNITAEDLSFIKSFEAYQPIFHSNKSNKKGEQKEESFCVSSLLSYLEKQIFHHRQMTAFLTAFNGKCLEIEKTEQIA